MKKNFSLFLERRTAATHGAPDLLPSTITRIVNYLDDLVGADTGEIGITWTKLVIAVITKHSPNALHAALAPAQKKMRDYTADITSYLTLIIAIYLDNHSLATQLLELGANPWDKSSVFGGNTI